MADEVSAGTSYVNHSDLHFLPLSLSKSWLARLNLYFCCLQVISRGGGHEITAESFSSHGGGDQIPLAWSSSLVEGCSCCLQNPENRKHLLKFLANKPARSSWLCVTGWFLPRLYSLGWIFRGLRKQCFFNIKVNLVKFSGPPANQRPWSLFRDSKDLQYVGCCLWWRLFSKSTRSVSWYRCYFHESFWVYEDYT